VAGRVLSPVGDHILLEFNSLSSAAVAAGSRYPAVPQFSVHSTQYTEYEYVNTSYRHIMQPTPTH